MIENKKIVEKKFLINLENLLKDIEAKKNNISTQSFDEFLNEYNLLNQIIFNYIKGEVTIKQITKKLKLAKSFI